MKTFSELQVSLFLLLVPFPFTGTSVSLRAAQRATSIFTPFPNIPRNQMEADFYQLIVKSSAKVDLLPLDNSDEEGPVDTLVRLA